MSFLRNYSNRIFLFSLGKNHTNILIFFIIFFYFLNSVLFSRNIFSNHILLLFTEASQLLRGDLPYKEINILYGIGQPLVNAFSLFIFGKNVFSIFLITNIFYFLSILFILLISFKLKFKFVDSFFLILILINIYPVPELPWSTFLSYFPIVLSLFFVLKKTKFNYFFSGFFLITACLIRETAILSAVIIFFYIFFESIFRQRNFNILRFYLFGFFIPLAVFVIYLFISSNYLIWKELVYTLYQWQSLINIGYYIKTDISLLRKFYIFFLAPYRELFLVFLDSIKYFWVNWILIYSSYSFCLLFIFKRVIKNKQWREDELTKYRTSVIAVYSLSLIIQNMHLVSISRVAAGSILGMIILFYLFKRIIQNSAIRFIIYTVVLILLFFNSHGVFVESKNKEGRLDKLYNLSIMNIKNNYQFFLGDNKNDFLDKKFLITEFQNMNYHQTTHKFYNNVKDVCKKLKINESIKYSDNQTFFWELPYFCEIKPKYYYVLTLTDFIEESFKKSTISKKYDSDNKNTIGFYVSDTHNLTETMYFDINGYTRKRKIKNLEILYRVDLKKDYPELFESYGARYFFITKNYKT